MEDNKTIPQEGTGDEKLAGIPANTRCHHAHYRRPCRTRSHTKTSPTLGSSNPRHIPGSHNPAATTEKARAPPRAWTPQRTPAKKQTTADRVRRQPTRSKHKRALSVTTDPGWARMTPAKVPRTAADLRRRKPAGALADHHQHMDPPNHRTDLAVHRAERTPDEGKGIGPRRRKERNVGGRRRSRGGTRAVVAGALPSRPPGPVEPSLVSIQRTPPSPVSSHASPLQCLHKIRLPYTEFIMRRDNNDTARCNAQ